MAELVTVCMCADLALMVVFNKLGSLLRHNALRGGSSAASPALFNVARLMSTKLFVGGEFSPPSSECVLEALMPANLSNDFPVYYSLSRSFLGH
jgi:hypothetical protein